MSKLQCLTFTAALLLIGGSPKDKMFAKYKPVAAYEIRSGVLAVPKMAANGEVCEVLVERIGSSFLPWEIDQIANELAPMAERGRRFKGLDNGVVMGHAMTWETVYDNVEIYSFGSMTGTGVDPTTVRTTGPFAFGIKWTKRKCK